jgi:ribosomal protein S12 methylthiotransferase accessory factor
MKLKPTILAETLLKEQSLVTYLKRILKLNLRWLSNFFGSAILLEVPENLQMLSSSNYKALNAICDLKQFGILSKIIKRIKIPDEPFAHSYFVKSFEVEATGTDLLSEEKALWKALAETAERYLWKNSSDFFKNKIVNKSYHELKNRAINIFSLAGFSEKQKDEIDIIGFNKNTIFGWIPAYSLISSQKIFCPLQLVSGLFYRNNVQTSEYKKKKEPMLRWGITTGLATGRSLEEATVKGILEIVERDAFMITYLNKLSPPSLDLDDLSSQDEDLNKILELFNRYNLEIHLINLPNDFSVNVILAIIIDKTGFGPALSVGASADFNIKTAVIDAISEAQTIRYSQINVCNKNKLKSLEKEKTNRSERMIFWSNPGNLPRIDFLLQGKKQKIDINQEKNFYLFSEEKSRKEYWKKKLKILIAKMRKYDYEACYVELTSREIKSLNFRCVFVVIPELQPMSLDISIPYEGGNRLKEMPMKFGYEPADKYNQEPHPFP